MAENKNRVYEKFAIVPDVFRTDVENINHISNFEDNHLLLFIYIQQYQTVMRKDINFTFNWFIKDLKISNAQTIKDLKKCLYDLDNWGLISWKNRVNNLGINNKINCTISKIDDKSSFTLLNYDYVDRIIKCNEDIRSKRIMLYLYTIIQSYKGNKAICFPSYNLLKAILKTNADTTITNNLEKLKKLNIIDFGNPGFRDQKAKSYNNIYITCDINNYKDILNKEISKRQPKTVNYQEINAKKNINISKTMRMTKLVKKWDDNEIDDDEKEELLELEKDYFTRKIKTATQRDEKLNINSKLRIYTLERRLEEYNIPDSFIDIFIDKICKEYDYNYYYDFEQLIMFYEKEMVEQYIELNPSESKIF